MPAETLTEARIRALRSRMSARDAKLKGFGVRVLPSGGGRYFIHCQHNGRRIWKIVGDADDLSVSEARSRATAMLAAIRQDTPVPTQPEETVFEAVSEAAFRRHERIWKPRTIEVNRGYLRKQVLPRFSGCQIAEITRQDVVHWFASLRATPVAADRSMPVLSVIVREAERMGFREEGSNPCLGIRRYRRQSRERFLSDAEIRSLAVCLKAHEGDEPLAVAPGSRKSSLCAGRTFARARCSFVTARPARERCTSICKHGRFSTGSRAELAHGSFLPRSALIVTVAVNLASDPGSAGRLASRTFAFMTCAIISPVTRSCREFRSRWSPASSVTPA